MARSEDQTSNPAMALFALGHADASLSFLKLLPDEIAEDVTSILAFRVLGELWKQYRIDCKINHGRTLLSIDNGYELRVFTALIDELADWPPLLAANSFIRTHSPALSAEERRLYDDEIDDKRDIVLEICDQIARLPADLDPIRRVGLLIDRCQKLEEQHEFGVCWALNLSAANRLDILGRANGSPPFPALFNREMLRFDRFRTWRDKALCASLTESAHQLSGLSFDSFHAVKTFKARFPDLRRNSRLGTAHAYLSGIGELSPTLLARLLGCSEPGARKMLRQLMSAGFAQNHPPSPVFENSSCFRLGWPGATWLRSYSLADAADDELFSHD
jgi:hypothetical protein